GQAGRVGGALLLGDRREGHALRRLMNLRGAAGDVSAVDSRLFDPQFDLFGWVAAQERQPGVVRVNQTLVMARLPRPPSVLAREGALAQRDLVGRPEAATDLVKVPAARPLTLSSGGHERTFLGKPVRIG